MAQIGLLRFEVLLVFYGFYSVIGQNLCDSESSLLLPCGEGVGDSKVPSGDDTSSGAISVGFAVPFFGSLHSRIFINTNGLLSLDMDHLAHTPVTFPFTGNSSLIAPFWADVDTRINGGEIYYRFTRDDSDVARLNQIVRNVYPELGSFSTGGALISTWYRVTYSGGGPDTPVNTFQCALFSDGTNTFAVFNYGQISWTTGALSGGVNGLGGTPALVGYNAGDGVTYASLPESMTAAIVDVGSGSNINVPGRYLYRLDGRSQSELCSDQADAIVSVAPPSGSVLGGNTISITGPCFGTNTVTCTFRDITVVANVNGFTAMCVVPLLFEYGNIDILLNVGTMAFTVPYFMLQHDVTQSIERIASPWDRSPYAEKRIQWNPQDFGSHSPPQVNLDFITFSLETNCGVNLNVSRIASGILNSGMYTMPDRLSNTSLFTLEDYGVLRIQPVGASEQIDAATPTLWSDIHNADWFQNLVLREYLEFPNPGHTFHETLRAENFDPSAEFEDGANECLRSFFTLESELTFARYLFLLDDNSADLFPNFKDSTGSYIDIDRIHREYRNPIYQDKTISGIFCEYWDIIEYELGAISEILPAPCTLIQARMDPAFIDDPHCRNGVGCGRYPPGAWHCVISAQPTSNGHAQHACYDQTGNLLDFAQGGGALDRAHFTCGLPYISNFYLDDLAQKFCCELEMPGSEDCLGKYTPRRPTHDCSDYEPVRTSNAFGDPHIITQDGKEYTFNGLGEYWLIKSDDRKLYIQGRTKQTKHLSGSLVPVTSWTAVVIKSDANPRVQIELGSDSGMKIYIDDEECIFNKPTVIYNNITVNTVDVEKMVFMVTIGTSSRYLFAAVEDTLQFTIVLSPAYSGGYGGLLGNGNGDPGDDLETQDGQRLSPDANPEELFEMGQTWMIQPDESLFTYPAGMDFTDFNEKDFRPEGLDQDITASPEAIDLCGDNQACIFDFHMTGNMALARATLNASKEALLVSRHLAQVNLCPFLGVMYGTLNTTSRLPGTTVHLTCKHGYEPKQTDMTATCGDNRSWSVPSLSCQDIDECLLNEHECEKYCINIKSTYRCACDSTEMINPDNGITCQESNQLVIILPFDDTFVDAMLLRSSHEYRIYSTAVDKLINGSLDALKMEGKINELHLGSTTSSLSSSNSGLVVSVLLTFPHGIDDTETSIVAVAIQKKAENGLPLSDGRIVYLSNATSVLIESSDGIVQEVPVTDECFLFEEFDNCARQKCKVLDGVPYCTDSSFAVIRSNFYSVLFLAVVISMRITGIP